MKSIYNFVCKSYKPVNIIYGSPQLCVQQAYSAAKRCAVPFGSKFAAFPADIVKNLYHFIYALLKFALLLLLR